MFALSSTHAGPPDASPVRKAARQLKVITATKQTQGQRSNDYTWCVDGEIVIPPVVVCRRDRDNPDGGCGCGRAWAGANSHRSTTTAVVRDVPISIPEYVEAIRSSLEHGGWWPEVVDINGVVAMATELLILAQSYPVGTVLERRLDTVASR
jgi:hypothetical protein